MQKNSILGFLAPATALAVLASAGHCMAATSAPSADGPGGQYPLLPSSMLAPNLIEASGAVIGSVKVANGNIFDLDDPAEDKALFRLANRLHIRTRPDVIEDQLLFEPGQPFSARALEESERLLRQNRFLHDATIVPVAYQDGVVDVEVATTDVWTLMPKFSLSRSGGANEGAIGLTEMNLFGTGTAVELLYRSDIDRDSQTVRFINRNLGHSWYGVNAFFANSSDGQEYRLKLGKPFYSLDSRDAAGISLADFDRIDAIYDAGEIAAEFRHQGTSHEFSKGWSRGLHGDWTTRYTAGVGYDRHRYGIVEDSEYPAIALPEDRTLLYPFVGIEFLQNKYEKARNYEQINRIEDRYLGTRLGLRLGIASEGAGSDRDAYLFNAAAQTGFGSSDDRSLVLATSVDGRIEDGGLANALASVSGTYYRRQSERRLLVVSVNAQAGQNLDLENYLMLGGDTGLRGYPLRYQVGDRAALFTIEQRFFTDWYPFRLFRVGGAAFFDAGRAWGNSPVATTDQGLLRNVGLGLRIGHSRAGLGRMTHIDLAFPLDGGNDIDNFQLVLSTKKSF